LLLVLLVVDGWRKEEGGIEEKMEALLEDRR
jgi:hypothetical protein